jgi:DNA modification methylase
MSDRWTVHHGDCREVMRTLDPETIDSIVTDPPYGLSFMGKGWDHGVPGVEFWREALRVAKPGAHLLAFGGTRTYHRLAVAIEDAGWEIRDCVMWVYGSGFPKSLDVSKAIDKQRAEDVEPAARVARWLCDRMNERGITRRDLCNHFNAENIAQQWTTHWTDGAVKPRVPKWHQWQEIKMLLSFGDEMDSEVWRLNGRKGKPGDAYAERPDAEYSGAPGMRESWTGGKGWSGTTAKGGAGVTDAARQWQGWGTALKPAWEPIIVARKPLVGTVAENVLTHGTGGLNVHGCRVGRDTDDVSGWSQSGSKTSENRSMSGGNYARDAKPDAGGRWPANLVHDGSEEVTNLLGDAARFFYCPKASKRDRDEGCENNRHPTVKPTDLMRYLCRLVTPPDGWVLDPFTGSGSTGKAAILEGFRFVGCELSDEYIEIARARIGHAAGQSRQKELALA